MKSFFVNFHVEPKSNAHQFQTQSALADACTRSMDATSTVCSSHLLNTYFPFSVRDGNYGRLWSRAQ